jgi:putative salt-induced outer membrane protein YdiY
MEIMHMKMKKLIIGCSSLVVVASAVAWAQNAKADDITTTNWHGNVAFGLSLARGNSDTFLMNASALAAREWNQNELKFGADGQYGLNNWGQSNQTQSADSVHGFADYKRLITDRFYGDLNVDGTHDDLADLRYRLIVGPAIGYYFIKSDATKVNGEIGPSFIYEKLGSNTLSYVTMRVSEHAEHSFNKGCKVWEQVDYLPQVDDFNNYLVNTEVGAEAALNTRLSLRIVAKDQFNSMPAAGRKENDITLVSAVVFKY